MMTLQRMSMCWPTMDRVATRNHNDAGDSGGDKEVDPPIIPLNTILSDPDSRYIKDENGNYIVPDADELPS